jgi:HTH-type transcriptional regulator, sugar sensing transcriptional regulator
MIKEEKIVLELKMLGMTEYEAKAYIGLLKNNPVTRYELAKLSGVPLPKVYETLDKMVANNWALAMEGNPAKYVPLDIENFLSQFKRKFESAFVMLNNELPKVQKEKEEDYIWNLNDYQRIMDITRDMLCEAEKSVHLSIWADEAEELKDALANLPQGVQVAAITFGDFAIDNAINYTHGQQFYAKKNRWFLAVVDNKRSVSGWRNDKGDWLGVWTENQGLVFLTLEYIKHDIYLWKIFNRFHVNLEEVFDKDYLLLRNVMEDKVLPSKISKEEVRKDG